MKELLTIDQLIEHMISKGIIFNEISADEAKEYLKNNNYYMKLASYRTNYEKQTADCSTKGQYINLDFAYLQELSIIDMRLRYIIMEMCLDLEHYIKLSLLNRIDSSGDDGYQLIRKFVTKNEKILKKIYGHRSSEYCKGLIDKYYPYFPAWVFVELISFGDLTYLCDFYSKIYGEEIVDNKFMNLIRDLRNASAHSNCLINRLQDRIIGLPDKRIIDYIKNMKCSGNTAIRNNLSKNFIYNFIVLIYVYDNIVNSEGVKGNRYNELKKLFNERMVRNKHYFEKNNLIKSQYNFLKKVVDKLD